MSRSPVTISILAWNAWDMTRVCLDALRPTLGVRDQVIVVDNGSSDATAVGLRMYPWVEVITHPENKGYAAGANSAAARARHDILLFLDNDTIPANHWIDPLAVAFGDPTVAAAGPRSNFVPGEQATEFYAYASPAEMRRYARDWTEAHRGEVSDATTLTGTCLAVRKSVFDELGGFDEGYGLGSLADDDLSRRLVEAGHRIVICHESFMHHEGHRSFDVNGVDWIAAREANRERFNAAHPDAQSADHGPLVSACLIVKNEEETLGACLRSLEGFADEIVIYDTGSTDGTVELARGLGAVVYEGYWDDDFARARNAALEHCSGQWIAWLDADETLETDDPAGLRNLLAQTRPGIDSWSVRIQNLTGAGVGSEFVHHANRLFRRTRCHWMGRVHEQVGKRGESALLNQAQLETGGYIRHSGYLDKFLVDRDKAARNIRLAEAEVADADKWDRGYSLVSLGRSLLLAGRFEEALRNILEGLESTDNNITRRLGARAAIDATLGLGRLDEALEWCQILSKEGGDPNTVNALEATVQLSRQEWEEVIRLASSVDPGHTDIDGFAPTAGMIASQLSKAYAALQKYSEAADVLIHSLKDEGTLDVHLGNIVDYLRAAGRPLTPLAEAVPADRLTVYLAQLLQIQPERADEVLEAFFESTANRTTVLAAASKVAVKLPIERALVWSFRLREAGHGFACPLVAIARTVGPMVYRARAAATAAAAFNDEDAETAFLSIFNSALPGEQAVIRGEAEQLCPRLLTAIAA